MDLQAVWNQKTDYISVNVAVGASKLALSAAAMWALIGRYGGVPATLAVTASVIESPILLLSGVGHGAGGSSARPFAETTAAELPSSQYGFRALLRGAQFAAFAGLLRSLVATSLRNMGGMTGVDKFVGMAAKATGLVLIGIDLSGSALLFAPRVDAWSGLTNPDKK